jgi:hypothetical protein
VNIEVVYLGHDNSIDIILKADGTAVDLSGVTQMTLTVGDVLVSSTNQAADPILWNQAGYATGEVHLILGAEAIEATDKTRCPLVVYDAAHTEGIMWGYVPLRIIADPEGESG